MALIPLIPTIVAGVGIPTMASWMSGDIRVTGEGRITEESLRKIAIGAVVGMTIAGLVFMWQAGQSQSIPTTATAGYTMVD